MDLRYDRVKGSPQATAYIEKIQAKIEQKKTQPVKMPKYTEMFVTKK